MAKKVLLAAKNSVIEPLGLLHLSAIARQEGWEPKITLVDRFEDINRTLEGFPAELLGMTVYTGNHIQAFAFLDDLRKKSQIKVAIGGPHPTYFPAESSKHADYTVLSEGFHSFRGILKGEIQPGIVPFIQSEPFPVSDRERFYLENPNHEQSPIKSIVTQSGCPYSCTYCYNSSRLEDIASSLPSQDYEKMKQALSPLGRLFPRQMRDVHDIIKEVGQIKRVSPQTQLIYFQDDVFLSVDSEWMQEFAKQFPQFGMNFHAQIRFEYADPKNPKNREKLELMREIGCTGLTLAIESADSVIRKEVLNRPMREDLMFEVFSFLSKLGYKVRTEQMLGLPYGATSQQTKTNLDADLETLELNVRLKEETGLPDMAWASIFAPYRGTKIGAYCDKHGFYHGGNQDNPETFFQRSILNFPRQWVGPSLSSGNPELWLPSEEQEKYKDRLQILRDLFSFFAILPKGYKLARRFLEHEGSAYNMTPDSKKFMFNLSTDMRRHLYDNHLYNIE